MTNSPAPRRFGSAEELLDDARSRLSRLSPVEAARELDDGRALLVDIRPQWQRVESGEVPGAWIVERNHLEWRLDPSGEARLPVAAPGQRWLVICNEGYTSSLAADALNSIGVPATDVEGGFSAWAAAGLSTSATLTGPDSVVGS